MKSAPFTTTPPTPTVSLHEIQRRNNPIYHPGRDHRRRPWINFMKKLLTVALIGLAVVAAGAQTNQQYRVNYTPSPSVFTGPTNVTVSPDAYNVFATTNVALPFNQWTLVSVAPAEITSSSSSNYIATTSTAFVVAMNPPIFVTMTYSNGLGTSPFAQAAGLQAYPVPPVLRSITSP